MAFSSRPERDPEEEKQLPKEISATLIRSITPKWYEWFSLAKGSGSAFGNVMRSTYRDESSYCKRMMGHSFMLPTRL